MLQQGTPSPNDAGDEEIPRSSGSEARVQTVEKLRVSDKLQAP